jgi:hypothetical protein|tara:strand:- start:3448 stop:4254 length:807 start_codon:yes stop_codon:yes gene_type:complete
MAHSFRTIGLLRFSVLTPTYYSERFASLEETAAHLFSPERMALRFNLFENLCLPSLVNQSDTGFDLLVLTAESMPEPYLQRLADLIEPHDHIHLRPVGTGKHYPLLREAYNSVPVDGVTHRIMFRLDDDDAVDTDFIRRTKRLANGLFHLHDDPPPTIIAYNRGFYVRTGEGEAEVFDACERAPLSTGVTLVAPVDHNTNPYRYVHRKFPQHYNTYSDISVPAFVRTVHGDNKSNPAQIGLTHKMKPAQIDAQLRHHFNLSIDRLKAL